MSDYVVPTDEHGGYLCCGAWHGIHLPGCPVPDLVAEVARLRTLIEPTEWKGWDQIDSIYEEARLLRRERDAERAEVVRLRTQWDALTSDEAVEAALPRILGEHWCLDLTAEPPDERGEAARDVVRGLLTAAIEAAQTTKERSDG